MTNDTHGAGCWGNLIDVTTDNSLAPTASFGSDRTLSLLRHGYRFWEVMRERLGSEIVRARFAHERVTAVRGSAAAEFFYEQPGTERSSALPTVLVGPLFGSGPVHLLDGDPHAHRKAMFTGLLDGVASADVAARVGRLWDERVPAWRGTVDVFDEVGAIVFEAGCAWIGIPLEDEDITARVRDMLAMVDGFGAPTARNLRARRARRRTDAWVTGLVQRSRDGDHRGTPLDLVAQHRDSAGDLLPAHTAAVEVINLIRPLVAVTWLASGLLRALADNPHVGADLVDGTVSPFAVANEVRRTQPFVPFLGTRARQDLTWDGIVVPRGSLLVLDVWGTNHDPRLWRDPHAFDPGRFEFTPVTPYNLVPQGGGYRDTGHRCPGEDLTMAVLVTLVERVARMSWRLEDPPPGLRRMPPEPHQRVTRLE